MLSDYLMLFLKDEEDLIVNLEETKLKMKQNELENVKREPLISLIISIFLFLSWLKTYKFIRIELNPKEEFLISNILIILYVCFVILYGVYRAYAEIQKSR